MFRCFVLALISILAAGASVAAPSMGPEQSIYHFPDRPWLVDGAIFCLTKQCQGKTLLYLVGDRETGQMSVYGIASDVPKKDRPTPDQACPVIAPFVTGPVYGSAHSLLYPAWVKNPNGILKGRIFIAVRLDGLTDQPGSSLRFKLLDPEQIKDPSHRSLALLAATGDPAATGDMDWPQVWKDLTSLSAESLDALKPADVLSRLTLLRITKPSERDALMAQVLKLDSRGRPEGPISPSECLPVALTAP